MRAVPPSEPAATGAISPFRAARTSVSVARAETLDHDAPRRLPLGTPVAQAHQDRLRFYGEARPHSSLDGRTPGEVYRGALGEVV